MDIAKLVGMKASHAELILLESKGSLFRFIKQEEPVSNIRRISIVVSDEKITKVYYG